MSKTYIGQRAAALSRDVAFEPFTKVVLWYDDENAFTAGTGEGRTLEIDCLWATQQMADDLLASLDGVNYTPFSADDALLDPAAELGDGVTVGDIYGYLGALELRANALGASDISAPGDKELDHEYPYLTPEQRALKRTVKLGQSYYGTTISRQYGVRVETIDAEGNVIATGTFNSDGIGFTTPDGTGIQLGADGKFHGNLVMDGSITWDDFSDDAKTKINRGKGDSNPSYIKRTYIGETKIMSPDIYAGMFYATGKGADATAAYYIYDGCDISGGTAELGTEIGFISYDTTGDGVSEAKNRVLFTTLADTALKINAAGNMSIEAHDLIYLNSPLVLRKNVHYGNTLPSTGTWGQLFFIPAEV